MDKVNIELECADAENLRRLLGSMNYYLVGAALCSVDDNAIPEKEIDQVIDQTRKSVNRIYIQLERQLGGLT